MSDRVLVVTGGSRGIGAAVAKLAGGHGYTVAVVYRTAKGSAADVIKDVVRAGGKAKAFEADVGDAAAVEQLFGEIDRDLGTPTALVNGAGITGGAKPFLGLDPAQMQAIVATNLFGTFYCTRAAARRMARSAGGPGGAIVNISSEAARFGGNQLAAYAAAKAGVNTFTVAIARELAPEGIRVNAVSPGVIDTDQHAGISSQRRTDLLASIPLKRMGKPEEVAEAVLWLLSDEASYVTGSILSINGGR